MNRKVTIMLLLVVFFAGLGLGSAIQQEPVEKEDIKNDPERKSKTKDIFINYTYPAKHSDKLIDLYVQYFLDNGASLVKENDTRTWFEFDTAYGKAELKYFYAHGDPCYEEVCGNPTFNVIIPEEFQYNYYPELPGYSVEYMQD